MTVSVRAHEAKMRAALKGVLGIVLTGSPLLALNHCSTIPADPDAGGACTSELVTEDSGDDSGPQCETFYSHPCGIPPGVTPRENCYFDINSCTSLCGGGTYYTCVAFGQNCVDGSVVVPEEAGLVVECGSCVGGTGRRPNGLRNRRSTRRVRDRVGEYFERAAHLEDASVHAFRIMQAELVAHGAPKELIFAAKRAQADEVRHARVTRKLARTHGGNPERARVDDAPIRSLEEMAIENAIEGCVRETFGALVAMWQAKAAVDPIIARAMEKIAVDETRHAALSWSLAAWIDTRLGDDARARVAEKRRAALETLRSEITAPVDAVLVRDAGLPGPRVQEKMLIELERTLALAA